MREEGGRRGGEKNMAGKKKKEEEKVQICMALFSIFYNPTLVCGLACVNSVRPVTLAAGMLYVLVPIQLFVFRDSAAAGSEGEGKALT